jgi:hypothetical protein
MKSASLALFFLLVGGSVWAAGSVQKVPLPGSPAAVDSPAAVVRELYRVSRKGQGRMFGKEGKGLQEKFFDKRLAGLIWKDLMETPEGDVGHIDFDPLFNAQDMKISNFRVGASVVKGDTATVPVSFKNYEEQVRITFRLVKTSAGWKIENIVYGKDSDFVKVLSESM